MKIKVGKRYINGQGTIVYINYKESENRFYGAPHNIHAQIPYDKNGKRISQICEDGLNLVAPYKPKLREVPWTEQEAKDAANEFRIHQEDVKCFLAGVNWAEKRIREREL